MESPKKELFVSVSAAQQAQQTGDEFHVEAHCFKNGISLFSKTLVLPKGSAFFSVPGPLKPSHGTLVVEVVNGSNTVKIRVESHSRVHKTSRPAQNFLELLHANLGRPVSVLVGANWISGTVSGVPDELSSLKSELRELGGDAAPRRFHREFVQLSNGAEVVSVPFIDIMQVKGDGLSSRFAVEQRVQGATLVYDVLERETEVRISWLEEGLIWSPAYHIQLSPRENTLTVSGLALIFKRNKLFVTKISLSSGTPLMLDQNSRAYVDEYLESLEGGRGKGRGGWGPGHRGHRQQYDSSQPSGMSATMDNAPPVAGAHPEGRVPPTVGWL